MNKKQIIFKTNHSAQIQWVENQIAKGNKGSIFLNPEKGNDAFEVLKSDLIPGESDIEKFIARYLSESGKNKLLTTLRVSESRSKARAQLQVRLGDEAIAKLNYLVLKSGLKKIDVINKLIIDAEIKDFQKEEEQLKITM